MQEVYIKISNIAGRLKPNLADIVRLLEPYKLEWRLSEVEGVSSPDNKAVGDTLHQLSDENAMISGPTLLGLAEKLIQVIDGYFRGYDQNNRLVVTVQAVDGMGFAVDSEDTKILELMRRNFEQVEEFTLF